MNIAIVTGASSGMGREFVLQLSKYVNVDEIWASARRAEALESLQTASTVPVRPISMDLCKEESFASLQQLLETYEPGSAVTLCLYRNGEYIEISVILQ